MNAQPLNPLQLPLHGLRLIEASAGTGKTWTIAALYLRLVLGHGDQDTGHSRPLLPPEILVVTFTDAATLELRERIRQRLSAAARSLRGQGEADDFLLQLVGDCDDEQRLRHARLLQLAADWMDEAAIHTIHSWCNRMLRQHAFDSGSLFKLELEAGDRQLLQQVVRDYWRQFYYPLHGVEIDAISRLAATPDALFAKVEHLLKESDANCWLNGEQTLPVEQAATPQQLLPAWREWRLRKDELERRARDGWRQAQTELEVWLRQALAQKWLDGNTYRANSFEQRLTELASWAHNGGECDAKLLTNFAYSGIKLKKDHHDKRPNHPAFLALDELVQHMAQQPEITVALQLHARRWIRQTYAERKQQRARLDYDDLLQQLDAALQGDNGPRLAQLIRQQYPVAMIDEFQDTDPLQYRIFHSVYCREAAPSNALLLIGDPKQAIYAFRGADIHTYLQAKRDADGRLYTLERNFRSTHELVAAVNRLFEYGDSHAGGAFKFARPGESNPLPFIASQARGRHEQFQVDNKTQAALTLWHWQDGDQPCPQNTYFAAMADATASQIVSLLNAAAQNRAGFAAGPDWRALRAADMAILVRNRKEAARVRQALAARGLRSVYLSERDSVFASQEAIDLLRWLRACAEPQNPRLLRAALACQSLNLSLQHLNRYQHDELFWEAEIERCKQRLAIWQTQGVLAMLRQWLVDFQLPQQLLTTGNGERSLTNLLHLSELLQAASVELDGEQALIRHLAQCIEAGSGDDDSLLRLESDSDLLKVVTLHKSKGLEYPLVFMPFIGCYREVTGKDGFYRFHGPQGEVRIDLGKSEFGKQQADHERLQEDLRLLYVGVTRAQHACWLGIAALKVGSGKSATLHKSAIGYLLSGGEAIAPSQLAEKLLALRGACPDIAIAAPPSNPHRVDTRQPSPSLRSARSCHLRPRQPWWIASYSALRIADQPGPLETVAPETARQANLDEADHHQPLAVMMDAVPAGKHGFPRGSQAGVFLHGLLETAAKTGFARLRDDAVLREQLVATACERRGWQTWSAVVNDWLFTIVKLPLREPTAVSLAQLARGGYQAELEFWFASHRVDSLALDALVRQYLHPEYARPPLQAQLLHGMLKGFVDLLFEDQGRYYLIDYKSNQLGADDAAYDRPAMLQAVLQQRYDLQACLYLLALQRLLKSRLGSGYRYQHHIGGVGFMFLRGVEAPSRGMLWLDIPQVLIDELDSLFSGKELNDAA